MGEPLQFHTGLYRRDAIELAAEKFRRKANIELADRAGFVAASLQPLAQGEDEQALRDEFCTEVFSATAQRLRDLPLAPSPTEPASSHQSDEPPWQLLTPFHEGATAAAGWLVGGLSPIRAGAAILELRHAQEGVARVMIRRNRGAPVGVAHTDHLDLMLMNNGGGSAPTAGSIAEVLLQMADTLRRQTQPADELLSALQPPTAPPRAQGGANGAPALGTPRIDATDRSLAVDLDESDIGCVALYDAVLRFAERCYIFVTRADAGRVQLRLKMKAATSADALAALAREVTGALSQIREKHDTASARSAADHHEGLPPLVRPPVDMEALLAELGAADPSTLGLGFQPERGPAHQGIGILNILGTGACNSDCLFCCEKFNPHNRAMPNADATRQLILGSSERFDMLFFASGEPTIHPKLFEYVELAKGVGFKSFGMSSHFRTFADPRFTLRTLQAGFQYFDISLHAADAAAQLAINPIDDGGASLVEALKGLAVLYRLADTLGIRITVTHKIVISRLNVEQLEKIFRATYDRGVRNFILQPVRSFGLTPERHAALTIPEEEILPHLNELLRNSAGLGAVLKPYGFARSGLVSGAHVESERNRVKNISGKARGERGILKLPKRRERRPNEGRFWVELRALPDASFGFATDGSGVVLDEGLQRDALLPFGCRMGSCGMCCARLLQGSVDQSTQIFLTEEQVQQGYVLLCQARPLSDVTLRLCTDEEIDRL